MLDILHAGPLLLLCWCCARTRDKKTIVTMSWEVGKDCSSLKEMKIKQTCLFLFCPFGYGSLVLSELSVEYIRYININISPE